MKTQLSKATSGSKTTTAVPKHRKDNGPAQHAAGV